jgi:hypothetical protein
MLYQKLDLPPIPDNLKAQAWKRVEQESVIFNQHVLGNSHGRSLFKDGEFFGTSTGLGLRKISDEFDQWIKSNIISEFLHIGLCVSDPSMDHSGPHRDQSRDFALLYLLQAGSDNATTSYWKEKPGIAAKNHSDYDDLDLLDQVVIPLETWYIIDAKTTHSVENIKQGRITVQIGLSQVHKDRFMTCFTK